MTNLQRLVEEDKGTLDALKNILPMIKFNIVAYDYLSKVIKDMEKSLKEYEGLK